MRTFVKNAISLICVLSLLFSMLIVPSAQTTSTTIEVVSQTIERGTGIENVEVPIRVINNTGILGMTVSVSFDKALVLVNVENGDALNNLVFTKSKEYTDKPYNLVWDGQDLAETNDGVIAKLTFAVPKGEAKDYAVNIVTSGVFDGNVQPFDPIAVSGKISVVGDEEPSTEGTTIKVVSQTIEKGTGTETVEVPIEVSNNTGILGMTVKVTFDDEIRLVNTEKGDALRSLTFTMSKEFTDTPYNLVWDGQDSAETSNGVIAILTFEVPKNIEKEYSINIVADGVFDGDVKQFTPSTENGKITVKGKDSSEAIVIAGGTDLNGIQWKLYETGTLEISGTGAMADYSKTSEIPWYINRLQITEVVIGDHITHIADRAFYGCLYLTKITIPNSVNSIGEYAFKNCDEVTIYGEAGSFAESYASENGISFVNTKSTSLKEITLEYASTTKKMYFDVYVEDCSEEATVYVAIYNVDGKMIDLDSETLLHDDITSLSLNKNENAIYAKIFVWGNKLEQITRDKTVSDL